MDNAIKAAMCFLVFALGVAAIIVSIAWAMSDKTPSPAPYYAPQVPHYCPPTPQPRDTMPTPNYPRPGSLDTGAKGDKK